MFPIEVTIAIIINAKNVSNRQPTHYSFISLLKIYFTLYTIKLLIINVIIKDIRKENRQPT